ncbi:MAG: AraC family transcriptional regulator [Bacteroidota bacterium]
MKVFYIQHMVCPRCIEAVEEIFKNFGAEISYVKLGEVKADLPGEISDKQLATALEDRGFSLLDQRESRLVNQVKSLLITRLHEKLPLPAVKTSVWVSEELGVPYERISRMFSALEGKTLEHFFLELKIEKVKEWLAYGEYSLREMAELLGYRSVPHLSHQFKQHTGFSPTAFRRLKHPPRRGLDEL